MTQCLHAILAKRIICPLKFSDIPTMKDNNEETLIRSGKDFDLIKAAQYLSLPSNTDTVALVDAELVDFKDELEQNREVADIGKL